MSDAPAPADEKAETFLERVEDGLKTAVITVGGAVGTGVKFVGREFVRLGELLAPIEQQIVSAVENEIEKDLEAAAPVVEKAVEVAIAAEIAEGAAVAAAAL